MKTQMAVAMAWLLGTMAHTVMAQSGSGPVLVTSGGDGGGGAVSIIAGPDGGMQTFNPGSGAVIVRGADGNVQTYKLGNNAGGAGGGGPGGGFDPAQMQQMMQQAQQQAQETRLDNLRTQLEVPNDDEWSAIRALVQKVFDARQAVQTFANRAGMARVGPGMAPMTINRFNSNGAAKIDPSVTALQAAIDSGAPEQLRTALADYRKAQRAAQDKLAAAQDGLRQILSLKQEAIALQLGLVN